MSNTFRKMIALICMLAVLLAGCAAAEGAEAAPAETLTTATPAPPPSRAELNRLSFQIDGPDESMPVIVSYSDFVDGVFTLEDLMPGEYTVTEIDPEHLLRGYTLDVTESVRRVTIEVREDETGTGTLRNIYVPGEEITPKPDEVERTGDGKINIQVTKIWEDHDNWDGNRPERVIVRLLGNGKQVSQAVLSEAGGWSARFTDLPEYTGGKEIIYTVTEDPVPLYTASVDGFTITNVYTPETTSASVMKVWLDQDNEKGLRPDHIRCTLSNGESVVLDASNGWSATIEGLPAVVNGKPAVYTWTEQETIWYEPLSVDRIGTVTVFTNALIEREGTVPEGKPEPPKKRGDAYLIIEEYGTPLGVEVIINHVGDCFD